LPADFQPSAGRAVDIAAGALLGVAATSALLGIANSILVVALAAGWAAWRRGWLRGRPHARALQPPLLLFSAASIVSAAASRDPVEGFDKLPRLLVFLVVPLAAAVVDARWWRRLVMTLGVCTTLFSLWGFLQYARGADSLADRIKGPFSHYMIFAGWVLLAVVVLLGEMLLSRERRRWWLALPVVLGTAALVLSYTRNAWVGLAAALLLLAAVWRRWLLFVIPALLVALWLLLPRPFIERGISVFNLRQPANYDRLCMTMSGLQMIRDYPFTGVGPGMVSKLYPLYRRDDAPRWRVPHLHNNPVQIAAERGLPALAAYLWLLGAFFTVTWRSLPRLPAEQRAAVGAVMAAMLAMSVAGLFEYNFWSAPVQYATLVLMGAGMGRAEERG
jgi:putative inorganic carbon (hco3(-)) transporter